MGDGDEMMEQRAVSLGSSAGDTSSSTQSTSSCCSLWPWPELVAPETHSWES